MNCNGLSSDNIFTKRLQGVLFLNPRTIFEDKKIGGVAEAFPIEYGNPHGKIGNLGYKMISYSSLLWFEFQKKHLTIKKRGLIYLKEPTMFLTNILMQILKKLQQYLQQS